VLSRKIVHDIFCTMQAVAALGCRSVALHTCLSTSEHKRRSAMDRPLNGRSKRPASAARPPAPAAEAEGGSNRALPAGRTTARASGAIKRSTLSERTYEALKERILDQTLPAGTRLNIDALSRELGVSSSPIREALARLEGERLVVAELYSGSSVAPQPTSDYLHQLLDFRQLLEGHCALIGAPRGDRKTLAQMRHTFARMAAVPQIGTRYREYRRFVEADVGFHQAIVDSAGNAVMSDAYRSLNAIILQSRLYRNRSGGAARANEVMAEHRRILEAFEAGDGRLAARLIGEHLAGGRRRLLDGETHEGTPTSNRPVPTTAKRLDRAARRSDSPAKDRRSSAARSDPARG
jgi:DNA-binding GntR family transcriptional regulator